MLSTSHTAPSRNEDDDFETYLLLLLSDSNLPTGGFVASSGLESFHAHGLLHNSRPTADLTNYAGAKTVPMKRGTAPTQAQLSSATLGFARSTLHSYARSSFGFLARVHAVVRGFLERGMRADHGRSRVRMGETVQERETAEKLWREERRIALDECLEAVEKLDNSYHTLLLNHVARRASKAQGIALLTLYSKAFAKPINLSREAYDPSSSNTPTHSNEAQIEPAATLVDRLKMDIRRSSIQPQGEQVHGHLPVCWAVFAACLGISLKKAVYLHLFLQARSLFSSSIRLNTLGPYLAHQVMRFQMRGVVEGVIREMEEEACLDGGVVAGLEWNVKGPADSMQVDEEQPTGEVEPYDIAEGPDSTAKAEPTTRTGKPFRNTATMSGSVATLRPKIQALRIGKGQLIPVDDDDSAQGWAWDWPEEQDVFNENPQAGDHSGKGFWTHASAPATTFPLGEIIQARHDQLHSRLFNS